MDEAEAEEIVREEISDLKERLSQIDHAGRPRKLGEVRSIQKDILFLQDLL